MNKLAILALSISSTCLATNANAANQVTDARGNAMGNTGVASADYLSAPFYNPALGSSFHADDDFAFLLPAIAVSARDTDDSLKIIDDLQKSIENYENSGVPSQKNVDELNNYLNQLAGNTPLTVTAGLGFATALPMESVSVNLFSTGYVEIIASPNVANNTGTSVIDVEQRYKNSNVDMIGFAYTEMGLSFAKEFTIAKERVSFGISPKYQQMATYAQRLSVANFSLKEYDKSENSKTALNFDLGVMWYKDNFRAGVAVKDLIAQEITAKDNSLKNTYNLDTQVTAAIAYTNGYLTAALDADLTKQTRFKSVNDDTQFVRVGIEGNAWGWAQLRAGYEIDLEKTLDNSVTAGIGISPFDVVSLDIAGSYAGDNQLGVSANLAFTF